jgi:hypothetical protein
LASKRLVLAMAHLPSTVWLGLAVLLTLCDTSLALAAASFDKAEYNTTIVVSTDISQIILTPTIIVDPSALVSSQSFSLSDETYFIIDGTTGDIYSTGALAEGSYSTTVSCVIIYDNSADVDTIQALVLIDVRADNLYAPVFQQAILNPLLAENSPSGTIVVTAAAVDDDAGSSGVITYSISSDITPLPFEINPAKYVRLSLWFWHWS